MITFCARRHCDHSFSGFFESVPLEQTHTRISCRCEVINSERGTSSKRQMTVAVAAAASSACSQSQCGVINISILIRKKSSTPKSIKLKYSYGVKLCVLEHSGRWMCVFIPKTIYLRRGQSSSSSSLVQSLRCSFCCRFCHWHLGQCLIELGVLWYALFLLSNELSTSSVWLPLLLVLPVQMNVCSVFTTKVLPITIIIFLFHYPALSPFDLFPSFDTSKCTH